jgi:chemotaxis family two-component system response regulator Rcp1
MTVREHRPVEILLVEDNPADVRLTREALRDAKVVNTLHVVEDGEAAVQFLRRQGRYTDAPRPDVILLDLNLPRRSGHEILADVKNDPELRSIPIVVLTTSQAEEDILTAYRLHANCYISKPVDLAQLTKVVRAIDSFWFTVVTLPRR